MYILPYGFNNSWNQSFYTLKNHLFVAFLTSQDRAGVKINRGFFLVDLLHQNWSLLKIERGGDCHMSIILQSVSKLLKLLGSPQQGEIKILADP